MKAGEDLDFASFPAYNSLKENLTKAKTESSGFSDIDESTTAVLKVLDEMVPLTSKMESYYTSKEIYHRRQSERPRNGRLLFETL